MDLPETRYARSGEFSVAYQAVGEGPFDLVWIPSFAHHVELSWENPPIASFLRRLASICRLIVFDKRGTGMSDRVVGLPTLETRMDDVRAVMDAAGSDRAVVMGLGDAGPLCVLFAATYPERTSALVLVNSSPRVTRSADLPWLPARGEAEQRLDELSRRWGQPAFMDEFIRRSNPDTSSQERQGLGSSRQPRSPSSAACVVAPTMSVNRTVASTRSASCSNSLRPSGASARKRSSSTINCSWSPNGGPRLRPGSSTKRAFGILSAMYRAPRTSGTGTSVRWRTSVGT